MRNKKQKGNTFWRRAAALLLVCCFMLPLVSSVQADALDIKKGKLTLYRYEWVDSYEELTSNEIFPKDQWVDVLLAWENTSKKDGAGDGTIWYMADSYDSKGNKLFDVSFNDSTKFSLTAQEGWSRSDDVTVFYDKEAIGNFRLRRTNETTSREKCETDSGDKNAPIFDIAMYDSKTGKTNEFLIGNYVKTGFASAVTEYHAWLQGEHGSVHYTDEGYGIKIYSKGSKKDDSDYSYGSVELFCNMNWKWALKHKNNAVKTQRFSEDEWDNKFRLYVRTVHEFDVYMDDIVVEKGNIFRVDDQVMLNDGATITVKDGGVMAVNSHLILNGKLVVEEGGTVILNEGAAVSPFCNEKDDAGSIDIQGGNVIVMDDAKLAVEDNNAYIHISNGGSLVNRGFTLVNSLNLSDSSRFVNEAGGFVAMGYSIFDLRDNLFSTTVDHVVDALVPGGSVTLSLGRMDISGKSQLINKGTLNVCNIKTGETYRVVLGSRTEGTVCRNEGNGSLVGSFGYRFYENSWRVRYRIWPNGWPDVESPSYS